MSDRDARDARDEMEDGFEGGRGFGGFLRSLLSGIPWSDRAEREESFELPSPASAKVKIFNSNGRTRIIGEDRPDVSVRALKIARAESDAAAHKLLDQIHINTSLSGDVLEIDVEIPRRWNRHGNVHLDVRLPRDHRVSVRSSNGKLCVSGLRTAVRAKSSNGPIKLSDVIGDIEVHTSNAKVACECTRGRLLARSSNGKIQLDDHCGSVDASTSNGVIHARLDELGDLGVSLATSNGRIVLELPEKVDADLDMRVDNGVIRNDRPLDAQTGTNGRVRGTLGRGGLLIKLRTSNGSISVR
jgi:hypothetical protein